MGVIKNSDVFDAQLFKKQAEDAKILNDSLNIVEKSLKDIAKLSVKAFKGVNPKTASDIKKVNKAVKESKKAVSELDKFQKQRLITQEKLKISNSETVKGLAAEQIALRKRNEKTKETILLNQKNIGTLERLALENKKLRRVRKGLDLDTARGVKRLKEINDQLDKNSKRIKENVSQLEKQKINIGNYGNSLKEAAGASGLFGGVLGKLAAIQGTIAALTKKNLAVSKADAAVKKQQAAATAKLSIAQRASAVATGIGTKALRLFKFALASTGIGLLVIALGAMIAFFSRSQKGIDFLSVKMAQMGAIVDVVIDAFAAFGESIFDAFSKPQEIIKSVIDFIKTIPQLVLDNIINRFLAFGVILDAIIDGNLQGISDGFIQLGTGVEDFVDKAAAAIDKVVEVSKEAQEELDKIAEKIKENARISGVLKSLEIELTREAALFSAQQAAITTEIGKQTVIFKDKLKSDKERLEAVKKTNELEIFIANELLELEKKSLAVSLDGLSADEKSLENDEARLQFIENIKNGTITTAEAVKKAAAFTLSSAEGEAALLEIIEKVNSLEAAKLALLVKQGTTAKRTASVTKEIANKKSTELAREASANRELAKDTEKNIEKRIELLEKAATLEIRSFKVRSDANVINAEETAAAKIQIEAKLIADIKKLREGGVLGDDPTEKKRLEDIQKLKQGFIDEDIKESERELEAEIRRQSKLTEITESDIRKRIDIVNEISKDSKEKIQKQAEFELENADLTAEERTLIAQKLQSDLAELENQRVNANKDANDEIIENEKKASKERLKEARKLANEVFSMTKAELAKKDKEILKSLDKEIKGQENLIEKLRQNAVEGTEKALAFEEARLEKQRLAKQREEERQAKRNEAIALAQTFLNQVAEQSKDNPDTAIAEAFKNTFLAKAIAKGLLGFYEGTDEVGSTGTETKFSSGRDGYVVKVDKGEKIFNSKQSDRLNKAGFGDRADVVDLVEDYAMGNTWDFMPRLQTFQTSNDIDLSKVVESNERVVRAIESIPPAPSYDLSGLNMWIETRFTAHGKEMYQVMLKHFKK